MNRVEPMTLSVARSNADVSKAVDLMRDEGVEAVAICFMNSFADNRHEHETAKILKKRLPDCYLTASNQLLPSIRFYDRVSTRRWKYINQVIVTSGLEHPRVKPGVAVAIVRDCLAALASLHREEIVHGDMKPSNIMLKRTGHAKIIDIGAAFELSDPPPTRTCTPAYAAPEEAN